MPSILKKISEYSEYSEDSEYSDNSDYSDYSDYSDNHITGLYFGTRAFMINHPRR